MERLAHALLVAAGLLAAASPGLAEGSGGIAAAFGNTIVSTYPDGRKGELWLKRDGSYAAEGRRHDRSRGHWTLKGEKLCLKQSHPIPVPFSYCTPVIHGGVGSRWTGKAVSGEPIQIQLVRGRSAEG